MLTQHHMMDSIGWWVVGPSEKRKKPGHENVCGGAFSEVNFDVLFFFFFFLVLFDLLAKLVHACKRAMVDDIADPLIRHLPVCFFKWRPSSIFTQVFKKKISSLPAAFSTHINRIHPHHQSMNGKARAGSAESTDFHTAAVTEASPPLSFLLLVESSTSTALTFFSGGRC